MTNEKNKQILADLQKGKKQIEELRKGIKKTLKASFKDLTKDLFVDYPELKSFSWTQYTPYFNDGESCEFDANVEYVDINGYGEYDDDDNELMNIQKNARKKIWGDDNEGEIKNPNYSKRCEEIVKTVTQFLKNFDNEDYLDIFGNHVKVVVTAKGIKVDEYEHD